MLPRTCVRLLFTKRALLITLLFLSLSSLPRTGVVNSALGVSPVYAPPILWFLPVHKSTFTRRVSSRVSSSNSKAAVTDKPNAAHLSIKPQLQHKIVHEARNPCLVEPRSEIAR